VSDTVLSGGFADPAAEAARAFRAVLEAMARPGTIHAAVGARPPASVSPAAGAVLLTLCDTETGLCLRGAADCAPVREWVRFHTGAPLVSAEEADFVLGDWAALMPLETYRIGTPDYPDRSATLIVEMSELRAEGAGLSGPGIKDRAALNLPDPKALRANGALYPLGLDCLFTCGDRIAALPRSTKVE